MGRKLLLIRVRSSLLRWLLSYPPTLAALVVLGCFGQCAWCREHVVVRVPHTITVLCGEPIYIPLAIANTAKAGGPFEIDETDIGVTAETLSLPQGTNFLIVKHLYTVQEGFPRHSFNVPAGGTQTEDLYLGYWGANGLPQGRYRIALTIDGQHRCHTILTVRSDREALKGKLAMLADRAIRVQSDAFSRMACLREFERYAPDESVETRLVLLKRHWRRLPHAGPALLSSIIVTLTTQGVSDPESVVRRLAALRDDPGTPDELKQDIDASLREAVPGRDMPKFVSAVKKHFGIVLRPYKDPAVPAWYKDWAAVVREKSRGGAAQREARPTKDTQITAPGSWWWGAWTAWGPSWCSSVSRWSSWGIDSLALQASKNQLLHSCRCESLGREVVLFLVRWDNWASTRSGQWFGVPGRCTEADGTWRFSGRRWCSSMTVCRMFGHAV